MDENSVEERVKRVYYNKRLVHPTRVFKLHGMWRAEYYMPYGGVLYGDHVTWREAMDDALRAVEQAAWG